MDIVRIVASTEEGPIIFDAQQNHASEVTLLPYPTGGWWGTLPSNDILPFILRPDGRLDFGATSEDSEDERRWRFAKTSLSRDPIEIGANFYFEWYHHTYKATFIKIEPMWRNDVPF